MDEKPYIYFASDLHLGAPNNEASKARERRFLDWLTAIESQTDTLFLVGDVFDFWFDYKTVVPKGAVRLLGRLAEWIDSGKTVHYFLGNHDMWMNGYLEDEIGVTMHDEVQAFSFFDYRILVGHGDGKGPEDKGYKRLKRLFRNPLARFAFQWLHPDIGMALASYWSGRSRNGSDDNTFLGLDNEWLVAYCKHKLSEQHFDYLVFGHRHLPLDITLHEKSRYINLGDWITYNTFARLGKEGMELLTWHNGAMQPFQSQSTGPRGGVSAKNKS